MPSNTETKFITTVAEFAPPPSLCYLAKLLLDVRMKQFDARVSGRLMCYGIYIYIYIYTHTHTHTHTSSLMT